MTVSRLFTARHIYNKYSHPELQVKHPRLRLDSQCCCSVIDMVYNYISGYFMVVLLPVILFLTKSELMYWCKCVATVHVQSYI